MDWNKVYEGVANHEQHGTPITAQMQEKRSVWGTQSTRETGASTPAGENGFVPYSRADPLEQGDCTMADTQDKPTTYSGPGDDFGNMPHEAAKEPPRWLLINLLIAKITAWAMFVLSVVVMAFAVLVKDDLLHDEFDSKCSEEFIKDAYMPASGFSRDVDAPGQGHVQCVRLLVWSYIIIVAGSFSLARIVFQGVVPVYRPTVWSMRYTPGSFMDRHSSPSRVYLAQCILSAGPFVLYFVGAVILGTSRLIMGPPADSVYRAMYIICLVLVVLSMVASLQQTVATGIASWKLKGWKKSNST